MDFLHSGFLTEADYYWGGGQSETESFRRRPHQPRRIPTLLRRDIYIHNATDTAWEALCVN
jgi:hypothetical protein